MPDEISAGRDAYRRRAWGRAYELLAAADRAAALGAADLERLAMAAYMLDSDEEFLPALERAHHAYLDAADAAAAVRCAFWIGFRLLMRGDGARGSGWLSRAQRLVQDQGLDCVEQGYLLLPVVEQQIGSDADAAFNTAARAVGIGERFEDADLIAAARHQQGRVLLQQGELERGLGLLDETMVAVTAGELSPVMTGLIYCSVIESCQHVYALDRAREWTDALARWCAAQPELISFTGACLVHRAEVLQLQGAWRDAIEESRRACKRLAATGSRAAAAAHYQRGEVHRLRGEFGSAEHAYREASRLGVEPQPGLALLRLAQGRTGSAVAAMRRVLAATTDRLRRARLLPAFVETMITAAELDEAGEACTELEQTARDFASLALAALATQARGALQLARADASAALLSLREASRAWQRLDAPYMTARVRELHGNACRALADDDGAKLELEAAHAAYERLGAAPDAARVDALLCGRARTARQLTPRERDVLRLVAAGKTNKAIAAELDVSERTIDRHLSNIFTKLDVPSRAAATAYAYEHELL